MEFNTASKVATQVWTLNRHLRKLVYRLRDGVHISFTDSFIEPI